MKYTHLSLSYCTQNSHRVLAVLNAIGLIQNVSSKVKQSSHVCVVFKINYRE